MKNYIILIVFASLLTGCSKSFLDRYPKDALSPSTFWKTKKDADLALTGLYNGFESPDNLLYRDCGSDNSYNNFPWEGWRPIGDGTLSPSNAGSSYFGYGTITRCNEFLKSADMDLAGVLGPGQVFKGVQLLYPHHQLWRCAPRYRCLSQPRCSQSAPGRQSQSTTVH